jgi:hypothetical protein
MTTFEDCARTISHFNASVSRAPSKFREKIETIIEQSGSLSEAARVLGADKSNLNRLRKGLHSPTPATVAALCKRMDDEAARELAAAYITDLEVIFGLKVR